MYIATSAKFQKSTINVCTVKISTPRLKKYAFPTFLAHSNLYIIGIMCFPYGFSWFGYGSSGKGDGEDGEVKFTR